MARASKRWRALLLIAMSLAVPSSAYAHSALPGSEGFANGLLHPVSTPTHVLVIIALGLFIGQRPPLDLKTPLPVFVPVLALALALTLTGKITVVLQPVLLVIALVLAALVALQKSMPPLANRVLAGVAAFAIGLDSGIESGSMAKVLQTLLGIWLMVILLVVNVAHYASMAAEKAEWLRVGIRVLASWIVAISLLMLAFALRK
jgi:hydrogenase/urease accessory protein HupE